MSQYGDETADVWDTDSRVARKAHACDACGETIRPGDRYARTFFVFDGDPNTIKRCARCEAIYKHLTARIRAEGDLEEFCDEQLNCGHEYRERWGEDPPPEIAALAFALPGEVRR